MVFKELKDSGLEDQIAAGIVLTGGTASIEGAVDVAEATFGMPVRVASPLPVKGLYEYVDQPSTPQVLGCYITARAGLSNVSLNDPSVKG